MAQGTEVRDRKKYVKAVYLSGSTMQTEWWPILWTFTIILCTQKQWPPTNESPFGLHYFQNSILHVQMYCMLKTLIRVAIFHSSTHHMFRSLSRSAPDKRYWPLTSESATTFPLESGELGFGKNKSCVTGVAWPVNFWLEKNDEKRRGLAKWAQTFCTRLFQVWILANKKAGFVRYCWVWTNLTN